MGIFQRGSPIVSVKKSTIFSSLFFRKMGLEIMFSYGLERKAAFEDDKNVNFLKSKKWVFSRGVHPLFRSKNQQFFSSLFFRKMFLEIMFSYGPERKKAFDDNRNFNFFNLKKWVFSKGVYPWFRSKNPQFF